MNASSSSLVLRRLVATDSAALLALSNRCAGAAQWGEEAYNSIESNGSEGWGVFRSNELIGFIIVRAVLDEMEILNLAVDPDARQQGIASHLFAKALASNSAEIPNRIFLEVRASNFAARAFYSAHGFVISGRRARYYSGPIEDALVLVRKTEKS